LGFFQCIKAALHALRFGFAGGFLIGRFGFYCGCFGFALRSIERVTFFLFLCELRAESIPFSTVRRVDSWYTPCLVEEILMVSL
jgi:hypothetical protein